MKAISLWQPWATLVVSGAKQFETRSWSTNVRGMIAIHAARKWNLELAQMCEEWPFADMLSHEHYSDPRTLPKGCFVGNVDLVGCHLMNSLTSRGLITLANGDEVQLSDEELALGDWTPGRYAWEFQTPWQMERPTPAVGHQGFWDVSLTEYFGE